jgi:hypothetical protein
MNSSSVIRAYFTSCVEFGTGEMANLHEQEEGLDGGVVERKMLELHQATF